MSHPPDPAPGLRRIIHIDMDAFYASVEQRDDPALRGVPVAVGGAGVRGVVAAASYEARKFGVHSAMPSVTARRKCPELVFVPARFDVYRAVSQQIRGIFARYTSLIQPSSLDEAYLDVTAPLVDRGSATAIAEEIREAIRLETGLTAFGRSVLHQVPCEARVRLSQAGRIICHHPANGVSLRSRAAGGQISWRRAGDGGEDEQSWYPHGPRPETAVARVPDGPVWQKQAITFTAWHGPRTTGP
jgi:hypothetical protein